MKLIIILLAVLLILCFLAGWVFFQFTFTRSGFHIPGKPHLQEGEADLRAWNKYREVHAADTAWFASQTMEEVSTVSDDGLKLYGRYFRCEDPKRIVLCVHGYRGCADHDFASISRWLHEEHCDLLLITQRGSGKSEGDFVTFGAKEKNDVKAWTAWLETVNPARLPVFLYGISMGCATVLLSTETGLPESVKGIIADCGYSSIRGILSSQARRSFRMPPYPILWFMEFYCILLAKFSFREGDAAKALQHNKIPVLFLHGSDDHFVLPENSRQNYEACAAEKRLVMIEHGVHASSYNENEALYQYWVKRLFDGKLSEGEIT